MNPVINPPPTHSLIEYFYPPESEGHRCGYCKSKDTNFTNGIWAHAISAENYENLINIGWRRSGCYIYKPMNEKICCPMYTIRNLSTKVEISRSQRKVLKRFRKYLREDVVPGRGVEKKHAKEGSKDESEEERMNECHIEMANANEKIEVGAIKGSRDQSNERMEGTERENQLGTSERGRRLEDVPTNLESGEGRSDAGIKDQSSAPGSSSSTMKKAHPLKRKFLRRERKRQKLIAKGQDPDEFFKRNERNRVKELADFFKNEADSKHQFTTKLVQVDSEDFDDDVFSQEHALYQKYQMKVHGDTEHECRPSQFRRFLCDNPFGSQSRPTPTPLGLFHQHYYIDSKLIAVGVIDLLPHCVSSVYFFYDPDFAFLSPGTLGALHEMHFVNELNKKNPAMQYYYLGFYIHTCMKMRYKRKFRPCELVCPITYRWVSFDDRVVRLLDNQKFAQLYEGNDAGRREQDITRILLLYNRRIYPYAMYPKKYEQAEELQSYVNLVTSEIASNMLLYRQSGV